MWNYELKILNNFLRLPNNDLQYLGSIKAQFP